MLAILNFPRPALRGNVGFSEIDKWRTSRRFGANGNANRFLKLLNRAIGIVAGPNGAASHLGMKRLPSSENAKARNCTRFCLVAHLFLAPLLKSSRPKHSTFCEPGNWQPTILLALPRWHLDLGNGLSVRHRV